jgi:hypothetical protein
MLSAHRADLTAVRDRRGAIVAVSAAGQRSRETVMLTRETVTFQDSAGWSWEFDLTFMLSDYQCIWGQGCPDTRLGHTARGCCVDGVEIYEGGGDAAGRQDLKMIRRRVGQLTEEDWQNRSVALRGGGRDAWGKARFARGSVHTRVYRGACIFHNRADHAAGAGCAFHVAALRRGEDPMDWKPRTCWQVPLFFQTDHDTRTTRVRAVRTSDWGDDESLDWWCTEHPDAYVADRPVYVSMAAELRRVCGAAVYDELASYCRARQRDRVPRPGIPLPMLPQG